ncbi:hypothetical protein HK105_205247 [Polyrhizophydium stewartii]|uniref:G protein-coupled receptor n=1 Tax=Polyrhizophydium stewartii TaxID=2732419 RepID=A0ABR4N6H1_9FUNG|nr:hypothetical protein HK105_003626 [Polyrhizophydium stewartii]
MPAIPVAVATIAAASANATAAAVPDSLIVGSPGIVIAELLIAMFGFTVQLCNTIYAFRHAKTFSSQFNLALFVSMVIYSLSFVPMFLTVGLGSEEASFAGFSAAELQSRATLIYYLNQTQNLLYPLSTGTYVLLVQIRFQTIRVVMSYPSIIDKLFLGLTVVFWFVVPFTVGALGSYIWPGYVTLGTQMFAFAVWTIYALLVDTILSFIFMYKIFVARKKLINYMRTSGRRREQDTAALKLMRNVGLALVMLCTISWISESFIFLSSTVYVNDPIIRKLCFRVAYACSPLQFTGGLILVYSITEVFSGRDDEAAVAPAHKPYTPSTHEAYYPSRTPSSKSSPSPFRSATTYSANSVVPHSQHHVISPEPSRFAMQSQHLQPASHSPANMAREMLH